MATSNTIVSAVDPHDTIEVIDDHTDLGARVRIREQGLGKASIYLTPDQLEEHAGHCLALAAVMRNRRG